MPSNPPSLRRQAIRHCGGIKTFAVTVFAAALLAGCGSGPDQGGARRSNETLEGSTTSPASPDPPTTLKARLDDLVSNPPIDLTTATLPAPPKGFSAAEVRAYGDRAIDLIERGISLEVQTMGEDAAFNFVFAGQPKASTEATRNAFRETLIGYSYIWAVASRFEKPPTEPARVLTARWSVTTSDGQTIAGPAPLLHVALSVAVEHEVPDPDSAPPAPVVMQRTVTISGYEPLGGAQWSPSIGYQSGAFLGGKCALVNGGFITPARRPATIREDLGSLRDYLLKPSDLIAKLSGGDDLDTFIDKYCEDA